MRRYFFTLENDTGSVPDLIGRNLADDEEAKGEAAKLAVELALNQVIDGHLPKYQWIEVVDDFQRPVLRIAVADAVHEPNRMR